jgi:hypothetical protein
LLTALLELLEDSFDSLASQADAAVPRHKTLIATLGWSYRLLSADEAQLLRHLSIFGGGFALEDVVGAVRHLRKTAPMCVTFASGESCRKVAATFKVGVASMVSGHNPTTRPEARQPSGWAATGRSPW